MQSGAVEENWSPAYYSFTDRISRYFFPPFGRQTKCFHWLRLISCPGIYLFIYLLAVFSQWKATSQSRRFDDWKRVLSDYVGHEWIFKIFISWLEPVEYDFSPNATWNWIEEAVRRGDGNGATNWEPIGNGFCLIAQWRDLVSFVSVTVVWKKKTVSTNWTLSVWCPHWQNSGRWNWTGPINIDHENWHNSANIIQIFRHKLNALTSYEFQFYCVNLRSAVNVTLVHVSPSCSL